MDSNQVTILNSTPVADAGTDQTHNINTLVTLHGSAIDNDTGDILTYSWTQAPGDAYPVTLTGANTANPTFTPTHSGDYHFTLAVTDSFIPPAGSSDSVVVHITVPHSIHIESINMSLVYQNNGWRTFAQAKITIRDAENNLVVGAIVNGHWTNATKDVDQGTTERRR